MANELRRINKQIENLLVARVMMDDIPYQKVDLGTWNNDAAIEAAEFGEDVLHTCGSTACFGGWVALHPHFQKQGVKRGHGGRPTFVVGSLLLSDPVSVSETLFGSDGMFSGARYLGSPSDKAEVLARIEGALSDRLLERAREIGL